MIQSKIEWTDKTWNPITGCSKISEGCKNCYAEKMAKRLKAMHLDKYKKGFSVAIHTKSLEEPLKWKKPHMIFVCSMSDIFHEDVSYEFIDVIFETILKTPQHRYQILTKRANRMKEYFSKRVVPSNVWLGVSVESKNTKYRIDLLSEINSPIRFISCEPLLEDLEDMNLTKIDWIIVGGESGTKGRVMKKEWVISIMNIAFKHNIAFFFKQWGTWGCDGIKRNKKANGKLIDGKVYQEMPKDCYFDGK